MKTANFLQILCAFYNNKNLCIFTSPTIGFPASDILQYEELQDFVFIELSFLGLCGVDAPLPQYLLNLFLKDTDDSKSFLLLLQIFNTRFYLLLFEAWRKFQISAQLTHQIFDIDIYLSHLLGFTQKNSWKEPLAYSDIFFGRNRNLSKLKNLLFNIMQHPVNIISNIIYWRKITTRLFLGKNLICGDNSILGNEVLDKDSKIIIEFFNFSFDAFLQYHFDMEKRNTLYYLTLEFLPTLIKFSFCFQLQFEKPRYLLGKNPMHLGWNSFLISNDNTHNSFHEKIVITPSFIY